MNTEPGCPFTEATNSIVLQTDASTSGWGAYIGNRVLQGQWSDAERLQHINLLEMKAVLLACHSLSRLIQHKTVLCLIDNTTAVTHLNHQGGTKSVKLLKLTKKVLLLANSLKFVLRARHLP